jgi:RNA polymerase sigma factor (sigma-70 family)
MMNDSELLQSYADAGSEAAFTELVVRYVDLVHSAAIRQVGGDAHLAEDVTQSVFLDLARKASSLSRRPALVGWLYTSTRFAAAKAVRTERRRHDREQQAYSMQELIDSSPGADWDRLRPALDDAMHELSEADRVALLLRYFEGRQLAEVGAKLGLKEDAARMRVGRALDKLRGILARRGVTTTVAALATTLGTQAIQAAPAGLAAAVSSTALVGAAASAGSSLTLIKLITMTKLKVGIIAALVVTAAATTTIVTQQQALASARTDYQSLRLQYDQLATAVSQKAASAGSHDATGSSIATADGGSDELIRLRGEVARYRQEARDRSQSASPTISKGLDPGIEEAFKTMAARASFLKERLEQMPDKKIPELRLLTDKDWLDAVKNMPKLETDAEVRQALDRLRDTAKSEVDRLMQQALKTYTKANGGQLPADFSQLKPFFSTPLDDAILSRYSLLKQGSLNAAVNAGPDNDYLVAETAPPVDDEYDTVHKISLNGITTSSVNTFEDKAKDVATRYAQDHNGLLPTTPAQMAPYFQQPVDPARLQALLDKVPAGVTTLEQLKKELNLK